MAHLLTISYGTVTVNLNSGNIRMMEQYVPRMGDGETTVDGVQLEFSGTAATDINASVASITKALEAAVRYNRDQAGTAVYVNYQPGGYASAYSSELVPKSRADWGLTLDNDSMGTARWGGVTTQTRYRVQGYLNWTRRDYWQGTATPLTISNPNGTATAGINVHNCNDAAGSVPFKRYNYFDVNGADIVGADLPCPVKVMVVAGFESFDIGTLWIANNNYGNSSVYAEFDFGGTVVADASASGGSVTKLSLSPTYDYILSSEAAITTIFANYGKWPVGIICRYGSIPPQNTTAYIYSVQPRIYTEPIVLGIDSKLQMMGVIPPFQIDGGEYAFRFYSKNSVAGTLSADYWSCIPMNNYIKIYSNATTDSIIYDASKTEYEQAAYRGGPFGDEYIEPLPKYGPGIWLSPNSNHRLSLFWDTSNGDCLIQQYFVVKLWYYPRRRLI